MVFIQEMVDTSIRTTLIPETVSTDISAGVVLRQTEEPGATAQG